MYKNKIENSILYSSIEICVAIKYCDVCFRYFSHCFRIKMNILLTYPLRAHEDF